MKKRQNVTSWNENGLEPATHPSLLPAYLHTMFTSQYWMKLLFFFFFALQHSCSDSEEELHVGSNNWSEQTDPHSITSHKKIN